MSFVRHVFLGAVAGAAGTAALNIATYGDMVLRGRGESDVPSTMVKNIAEAAGAGALASDDEATAHRRAGIGALLGYANGLGVGVAYGLLRPGRRGNGAQRRPDREERRERPAHVGLRRLGRRRDPASVLRLGARSLVRRTPRIARSAGDVTDADSVHSRVSSAGRFVLADDG
jgi:hypothetical protein